MCAAPGWHPRQPAQYLHPDATSDPVEERILQQKIIREYCSFRQTARTPCNSKVEDDHPLTSHACSGSQTGSIDRRAKFHNSQFRIAKCAVQNQRSPCQWGRTPPHAYDVALHGPRWFPLLHPILSAVDTLGQVLVEKASDKSTMMPCT